MEIPSILRGVSLREFTTLNVGGEAHYFSEVDSQEELESAVAWATRENIPMYILGGGSNVLVPDTGVPGLVIRMHIGGVTYTDDGDSVLVTAGAGTELDTLIQEVVQHELWGIENLSAIPGTVGALPIQNVGAYGREAKDVIENVEVYDTKTFSYKKLTNTECRFGYRDSLFKHNDGRHLVVVGVTVRLSKIPQANLLYRDLAERFGRSERVTLSQIREAVREIRSHKFPDWHVVGTAGSFFKNPVVSQSEYERLHAKYPAMPVYVQEDENYKVPLGWILENVLSLKGWREGNVGLYEGQALVLVNYGGVTADEIFSFSEKIIQKVFEVTALRVEREVVLFV